MTPDLVIVVPSRERPDAMSNMLLEFVATCTGNTVLVPVVDNNDPTLELYPKETLAAPTRGMVQTLNWGVASVLNDMKPYAVGFMGDDHRPITRGWDKVYLQTLNELQDLRGAGIVYGNDLLQGKNLPTQVAMTANIPRALGYMAPPQFGHLFVDNVWKAWGEKADCMRYLPDIIIEHRHPIALKAKWDAGYHRVNSETQQRADRQKWFDYRNGVGLTHDAAVIKRLR